MELENEFMKVKDLVARLQEFDPEMEVTTASYEFGLVSLELLGQVSAVAIPITEHNAAQWRPARRIDGADQVTVVCCGPSDPSFVFVPRTSAAVI